MITTYKEDIPQCFPAMLPAGPKSDNPTITIAGAMVRGVMYRRIIPTTPSLRKQCIKIYFVKE